MILVRSNIIFIKTWIIILVSILTISKKTNFGLTTFLSMTMASMKTNFETFTLAINNPLLLKHI